MAAWAIRAYEARDFAALYKLDQACFPPGISYSKWSLQYFLNLATADCLVAEEDKPFATQGKRITGFILAEKNPPLAHIITLDVAPEKRRTGLGSALIDEIEKHFRFHEVKSVLLETAVDNETGIAFWQHHGYRTEAVLKRYYLGKVDAYEMRKRLP
ncbi:MAG TPA: N-acetyltransferase [Verrucomicrobiae bacterium]|nr:N-acetyltransferase [Verrucomicrobiae bacterium]